MTIKKDITYFIITFLGYPMSINKQNLSLMVLSMLNNGYTEIEINKLLIENKILNKDLF